MEKRKLAIVLAVTATVSAAVSSLVTYQVANHKLGKAFDERLEREKLANADFLQAEKKRMREAKVSYGRTEDEKPDTPTSLVSTPVPEHLDVAKIDYTRYAKISENDVLPVPEHPDEVPPVGLDEIEELDLDTFMSNDSGYTQLQFGWYNSELVLDEDNDIVPDHVDRIGNAEPPFGGLSGEEHIAYLRNNRRREEYEVRRELMTPEEALGANVNLDGGSAT